MSITLTDKEDHKNLQNVKYKHILLGNSCYNLGHNINQNYYRSHNVTECFTPSCLVGVSIVLIMATIKSIASLKVLV